MRAARCCRSSTPASRPLARDECPFVNRPRWPDLHFVEPVLVCEVEFTEWTEERTLRHPVFKGLRES